MAISPYDDLFLPLPASLSSRYTVTNTRALRAAATTPSEATSQVPIVCRRFVHSIMMIHRGAVDGGAFRLRSTCPTLWKRAFPPRMDSQRFELSSPSILSITSVVNPLTTQESFKLLWQITTEIALGDSGMQQPRILSEIRRTVSRRSMDKQSPLLLSATER